MYKYIDVDELLKRLNTCKYPAEKTTKQQVAYNAAINDTCRSIDAMPAADVEKVKHGHWDGDSCSVCWFSWCDITYDVPHIKTSYCPMCGAKMDLEKNNG